MNDPDRTPRPSAPVVSASEEQQRHALGKPMYQASYLGDSTGYGRNRERGKRVEHVAARTNETLPAAACIVALAVMMQFYHPRGWEAWVGVVFWVAVAMALIDYVRTLLGLRSK